MKIPEIKTAKNVAYRLKEKPYNARISVQSK
jgi:hypothetical protein